MFSCARGGGYGRVAVETPAGRPVDDGAAAPSTSGFGLLTGLFERVGDDVCEECRR